MLALFVNAAILIVAAAVFHANGETNVQEIDQAYRLLSPLLGVGFASALFATALPGAAGRIDPQLQWNSSPSNCPADEQCSGPSRGLRNGAAIVSSFGQVYLSNLADGTLVFLDVEGPPNPSLSILALFSIVPLTILGKGQMALY